MPRVCAALFCLLRDPVPQWHAQWRLTARFRSWIISETMQDTFSCETAHSEIASIELDVRSKEDTISSKLCRALRVRSVPWFTRSLDMTIN
ncbi:hypothetical protein SAMN05216376_101510 [Mameliella alba]|nr:hypothetical protein CDZ96_00600 [Mameliella alba]OWV62693.1 hypothetical protein CDZ98_00455 [Mameliella alba]PTR42587.1 hypothetical protein LX94_00509 [Mameliella alba]GGF72095.1 hypothetical protein GCM10011319_35900 [Mameliella alba]SDC16642.1 hypothetical protein SAMN05216376_101510 [Mameliella alba]